MPSGKYTGITIIFCKLNSKTLYLFIWNNYHQHLKGIKRRECLLPTSGSPTQPEGLDSIKVLSLSSPKALGMAQDPARQRPGVNLASAVGFSMRLGHW